MKKNKKTLALLITFLSGFSFLIYEISWNRFLSLKLGTTVVASTIVLMAFMAGFGFGANFIGKKANNKTKLGKIISFILGGIGILSIFNYLIIDNLSSLYSNLFHNITIVDIFLFISTFLLLFIPAFLMGGIIPVVNKIISTNNSNVSKNIGHIYATETIGSAMGGLLAGFILIGNIGQKQTIIFAATINILLAIFLLLSKSFNNIIFSESYKISSKTNSISENSGFIALITTFFIGFSILSLQILWIRIFKTYFTNTSYTFSLITSFVILGLSAGSWIYKQKEHKIKNYDKIILKIILLLIFVSLVGLLILLDLPDLLLQPFKQSTDNQFIRLIILPLFASILIVFPPSVISGFAFPVVCNMYSNGAKNISKNIGKVMQINTLGSVLGPAITTFIFIPFLGAGKAFLLILSILSISAIFILQKNNIKLKLLKPTFVAIAAMLILFTISTKELRFLAPSIKLQKKEILVYQETIEGTIIVTNEPNKGIFGKSTYVNNSTVIGSNYDAIKAVKMVGHLPFFVGTNCKNVLIIGFGIGVTTSAIAQHSEVEHIDCVELVLGLVQNAHYYSDFNNNVYNDSRLNIISGDGRHYLQTSSKKYDLISCDPTHPVLGSGNLYTKDYFSEIYEHLTTDGVMTQYLPLHKLRLEDLLGIIKTFNSVFENSYVWLGQYHAILLGRKNNELIDFDVWKRKIYEIPMEDFLYLEPYHLAASLIFDNHSIENFPADLKINTDNLNYTEFFSFKSFDESNIYNNLNYFNNNRCDIYKAYKNLSNKFLMDKFLEGNILLTNSFYYSLKGQQQKAIDALIEASKV
ncbi:MAG: fused MFS/spermidine synthase, partial [Bacteroidales bacterium]|nr:fused MFS/spermidine synthase [Bacteroidales bacterium]